MEASCRDVTVKGIALLLIIFSVLGGTCNIALAQNEIDFTPMDEFAIPSTNGVIAFAVNGTYASASLANDVWKFENLHLSNSAPLDKLLVAAQNSNVTIISYRRFNATIPVLFLRYVVEGRGKQIFNLGLDPEDGEWSVIFDDAFMSEGDGWSASPEGTLTITGATYSVIISYYGFPDAIAGAGASNQPFYERHSVAIVVAVALAITVTLTVLISLRVRKRLDKTGSAIPSLQSKRGLARG